MAQTPTIIVLGPHNSATNAMPWHTGSSWQSRRSLGVCATSVPMLHMYKGRYAGKARRSHDAKP